MTKSLILRWQALGVRSETMRAVMVNRSIGTPVFTGQEMLTTMGVPTLGTITPASDIFMRASRTSSPVILSQPDSFAAGLIRGVAGNLLR